MIGIAGARPMAQRHGRRHACFAREDHASVLRRERAEIQQVDLEVAGLQHAFRRRYQPVRLRHLARAGLVVARCRADQQHARSGRCVAMTGGRPPDLPPGVQPLDRQFEIGIGEAPTGPSLAGASSILAVALPGQRRQAVDVRSGRRERRVVEALAVPAFELSALERPAPLAFADRDARCASARSLRPHVGLCPGARSSASSPPPVMSCWTDPRPRPRCRAARTRHPPGAGRTRGRGRRPGREAGRRGIPEIFARAPVDRRV